MIERMMQRAQLVRFLRAQPWAVLATASRSGFPQSAVVGVVVTDDAELVFDTAVTARKTANLRADPRISLVLGWDEGRTVQYEGLASEPAGEVLEALRHQYFARFPDGVARAAKEETTYFVVRPTWVRYSDFSGEDDHVEVVIGG